MVTMLSVKVQTPT